MIPSMGFTVVHGAGKLADCKALVGVSCNCASGGTVTTIGTHSLCNNAVYIGCGVAALEANAIFDSALSSCAFNPSTTGWNVSVGATGGSFFALDSVEHGSLSNSVDNWPSIVNPVPTNVTYPIVFAKFNVGYFSAWGANWALTCPSAGAVDRASCPGCEEYNQCGVGGTCTPTPSTDECDCGTGTGKYLVGLKNNYYSLASCNTIPLVGHCYEHMAPGIGLLTAGWRNPGYDGESETDISYKVGVNIVQKQRVSPYLYVAGTLGNTTLKFGVFRPNIGTSVKGDPVICADAYTAGPSSVPTSSPTFRIPVVPNCTAEIQAGKKTALKVELKVTWVNATGQQDSTPGELQYYLKVGTTTYKNLPCCSGTYDVLIAEMGQAFEINACPPVAYSVTNECQGDNTVAKGVFFWTVANSPKTTCVKSTLAPTAVPSMAPTTVPSDAPSAVPTMSPTLSPTFEPLTIPSCQIEIVGFGAPGSYQLQVNITRPSINALTMQNLTGIQFQIMWNTSATQTTTRSVLLDNQGFGAVTIAFHPPDSYDSMAIEVVDSDNKRLSFVKPCQLKTSAPTSVPSSAPSSVPSGLPTGAPSMVPSAAPSRTPTSAPTYSSLWVQECTVFVYPIAATSNELVVTWVAPDFPPTSDYPFPNATTYGVKFQGQGISGIFTQPESHIRLSTARIPFNDGFQRFYDPTNSSSQVSITVVYTRENSGVQNPSIKCNQTTQAPSKSPTSTPSHAPTISPTYGPAHVYLELDVCPNRCECCSVTKSLDPTCKGGAPPQRPVAEGNTIPVAISRFQPGFPNYVHNVTVFWRIRMVNLSTAIAYNLTGAVTRPDGLCAGSSLPGNLPGPGDNSNVTTTVSPLNDTANITNTVFGLPPDAYFEWLGQSGYDCSLSLNALVAKPSIGPLRTAAKSFWKTLRPNSTQSPDFANTVSPDQLVFAGPTQCDIVSAWSGSVVLTPSDPTAKIDVQIHKEGARIGLVQDDVEREAFLVELTGCTVTVNPSRPHDSTQCDMIYPSKAFLVIINTEIKTVSSVVQVPNQSFLRWLPWVLAGIALFLCLLSYLLYRLYVNYRLVKAQKREKEMERDQALDEREMGFGKDLGQDQVQVNPLATGIPQFAKQQDDNLWAQTALADQQGQMERAEVRVDRFNMRQEFGPTQKTATGTDMYSSQMLI